MKLTSHPLTSKVEQCGVACAPGYWMTDLYSNKLSNHPLPFHLFALPSPHLSTSRTFGNPDQSALTSILTRQHLQELNVTVANSDMHP